MEIGKDISQKIRSAIKSKLIELAAYVDDELPDYIMVMVANKKTKEQMTDDLSLFLGINTEKFTEWLHGLLSKLQTVGSDKPKSDETSSAPAVEQQKEKTKISGTKQKQPKAEKEKVTVAKVKSKEQPKASTKTVSVAKSTNNPKVIHVRGVKEVKKAAVQDEYVLEILDTKGVTDEFNEELKKEEEKSQKAAEKKVEKTQTSKTKSGTAKSSSTTKKSSTSTTSKSRSKSKESDSTRPSTSTSQKKVSKTAKKTVKRSTDSDAGIKVVPAKKKKPMSVVGSVKRKYEEADSEEEYDPLNPAVGSVASVVRVTPRRIKVPPSLQANKSLLMKAVDDAEKSVSSTMQQVLMEEKMYSERVSVRDRLGLSSNKGGRPKIIPSFVKREHATVRPVQSRSATVKPLPVTFTGKVKDESGLQLVSNSRRDEMLVNMKYTIKNDVLPPKQVVTKNEQLPQKVNMTYTIRNDIEPPKKKQPEVARVPPVMDKRFVQCVEKQPARKESDEEEEEMAASDAEEVVEEEKMEEHDKEEEDVTDEKDEQVSEGKTESDGMEAESEKEEMEEENEENPSPEAEEVMEEEEEEKEDSSMSPEPDPEIQQLLVQEDTEFDVEPTVQKIESNRRLQDRIKKPRVEVPAAKVPKIRTPVVEKSVKPVAKVNPKFIVTLDGVDHSKYEGAARKANLSVIEDDDVLDLEDTGMEDDIEEVEEEEEEQVQEEEEEIEEVEEKEVREEKEEQRITKHVKKEISPKQPVMYNPPEIQPISINLQDSDDEEVQEEDTTTPEATPLQLAKMSERCKFWPACVNGNSCQYHHPTVPCKMFPHCKFGEKCLYIHPNCMYDAACTRKDCPFTHASKRGNVTTIIQKIVPVPVPSPSQPRYSSSQSSSPPLCRFFPNCSNVQCPFRHPKPCRFGMQCSKKAICPFHHPPLPTKDKLKWTAGNKDLAPSPSTAQSSSKHISERKFDSSGPTISMPTQVK